MINYIANNSCSLSIYTFSIFFFTLRSSLNEETEEIQLTEETVNLGGVKLGPGDFELKKVLGKGGYGKVFQVFGLITLMCHVQLD